MISDLHFLRPWGWLLALPLPLWLFMLARNQRGRAALSRLADANLLPHLIRDHGARERGVFALAATAWLLAVAALAGPAWQRQPAPLYANGAARVIALSLSGDMRAQDVKPDRMTRARFAVHDLLDAAGDARTALIGYAGDAFVVAPLTSDKATVLNLLQALGPDVMPAPGNDAARAIAQSLDLLRQAHVQGGEIVLVTDDAASDALAAARTARAAGVRVDVLGIGSPQGAPVPQIDGGFEHDAAGNVHIARLDESVLRALADAGGGTYAPLGDNGDGVAMIGAPPATRSVAASRQQADLWRDAGAWLLLPLLPLAALAFRRGWVCVLALCFIVPQARAATWQNLWSRPDQQALQALHDGDYAQAQRLARDAQLRGAAAYRQGNYEAAATEFARGDGVQAQYDLGNALAKGGKYQDALAAYDCALQRDPSFADARANRQAVQDWLKRHPPPQQPKNADGAQGNGTKSQQGGDKSRQSAKGSSGQSNSDGQDGQSLAQNPRAQAGNASGNARESGNADSARGKAQGGDQRNGDTGASLAEDNRQREQAQRAQQALQQALAQRGTGAQRAGGKPQGTYALGAGPSDKNGKFDPQQRAMLDAVPDDPGALLRRKFLLEWQRRHGQATDDENDQ
ncbi:MAG TPA: VWA domain-containing protein [Rhodanobacteraceae bacterium]|nr:VWA domain-containing protein [Rhodanobacteraceae bacterium]